MSQLASCVQSRIVRSAFGGGTRRGNDCDSRGRGWAAETWLFTKGDVTRRRENLPPSIQWRCKYSARHDVVKLYDDRFIVE